MVKIHVILKKVRIQLSASSMQVLQHGVAAPWILNQVQDDEGELE
jgi:hypothetical protein